MHDNEEISGALNQLKVPEASAGFEARIIETAHGAGRAAKPRFWQGFGPQVAFAASIAAAVMFLFNPLGQIRETMLAQNGIERYTVGGVSLLADVELIDEPEFDLAFEG